MSNFDTKLLPQSLDKTNFTGYLERIPGFYFLRRHLRRFKRACSYFKFGYNNHEWDNGYLHRLTLFKLKRMQRFFTEGGSHSPECPNYIPKMKSLDVAIMLLEKFLKDETKFLDLHSKKWGELKWEFVQVPGSENEPLGPYSRCVISRPNALTEEEKIEEREERLEAYSIDDRRQQRFLETAYKIIGKHSQRWWD